MHRSMTSAALSILVQNQQDLSPYRIARLQHLARQIKTFNIKNANTYANADAGGSAIALAVHSELNCVNWCAKQS